MSKALKSPAKRRRNASNAKAHFDLKSDGRMHCKQLTCNKSFTGNSSTTSFMYHLSSAHKIFLIDNDEKRSESSNSESDKENLSEQPTSPQLSQLKSSNPEQPQKFGKANQSALNDFLINLVVQDNQAFNITMSQSFLNLVNALNPSWIVPDSHTLRQLVKKKYEYLKRKVKNVVATSRSKKKYTTDGWSSNQMDPYLSLSCHFIDNDFKYWDILLQLYLSEPRRRLF
jgi:hypothetical protein